MSEKLTAINYIILIVAIAGLGTSLYSVSSLNGIKKSIAPPETVNLNDFMLKVTGHTELSALKDTAPLNVIQISTSNLASLQGQIQGLNINHLGKFLIQYADRVVLYDYAKNTVEAQIPVQQQLQLPKEISDKLYAHPELKGLSGTPQWGVLDQQSLISLQQNSPDVYKDAKIGDVLLRFPTALVIYDGNKDKVVNKVPLEQETGQ